MLYALLNTLKEDYMMIFHADGRHHEEFIFVEDGKIVRAHYEEYSICGGGGGYNPCRGESDFEECVRDCMCSMIKDDLNKFKNMLRTIKSDKKYFQMGKSILNSRKSEYDL